MNARGRSLNTTGPGLTERGARFACQGNRGREVQDAMLKLKSVEIAQNARHSRLVAHVEQDRGRPPLTLMFEYPRESAAFLRESADAFVPALLIPCMHRGEALEIVPPVSTKLFSGLDTIQNIQSQWWPELRRVEVAANQTDGVEGRLPARAASFFSGGIDSFYTCLKHAGNAEPVHTPPLTHLVHMAGVERPLDESVDARDLHDDIRRAAAHYGLDVVIGRTNIRSIFRLSWSRYYHGAGLSAIGHSLASGFSRVYIPSTHTFRDLFPWGSHPLVDPLWSSEQMEIVHDGCEVTRVEKTARVAADAFALEHLRVCLHNGAGPGNCGRCKKCIRTMVALEVLGVLPHAKSFPARLPDGFDRLLPLGEESDRAFVEELVSFTEQRDPDNPLASALRWRLRQTRRRGAARSYVHNSGLERALPAVRLVRGAALRFASIVSHMT